MISCRLRLRRLFSLAEWLVVFVAACTRICHRVAPMQQYISCLQQLLPRVLSSRPVISSSGSNVSAVSCRQAVESLVLQRREMTDRHALFSHYYWAVWCFNRGELAAQGLAPPTQQQWEQVMHSLNLRWVGGCWGCLQ
jgi:hypothetical protein